jgi:hypothetical protein
LVDDFSGQALFPLQTRRIAANIAKLPELRKEC